jgi:glycosyltransferase involved in cell wall biosynthesis
MSGTSNSTGKCFRANRTSRDGPSLLVFADDWGRHPSSCQHLIRNLLDRYEVFWVNTIGTRKPRFDLATLRRGLEKVRQWLGPARPAEPLPTGLHVLNPPMWPRFTNRLDRRLNLWLLRKSLLPLVRSLRCPPVAVTTLPLTADLIGRLPVRRWVYYCVDDFGQWPGLDQAVLRRMEQQLVERVDAAVAVSKVLQEKLGQMGKRSPLLTHGVDLDFWATQEDQPQLPALKGLPRPLIVFWGVVDRRLDVAFLRQLAADLSQGTVLLAGPPSDYDTALDRIPRLHWLAPVPYGHIPRLAREAAVLIMPYADLPVTRAIQPLKLKEYLATGLPVVVRDLPATREWADGLDLANSADAFSQTVRLRIRTGLPVHQRSARVRLGGETWTEKARAFERWAILPEACRQVGESV